MDKEIIIKPSFIFKEYLRINIYMFFIRPYFFIVISVILVLIFINILIGKNSFHDLLFLYLMLIFYPFINLFSAYKASKKTLNNYRLKEDIYTIVTNEFIEVKGDTFYTKHHWNQVGKIVEKKNWFLFYVTKSRAIMIRKADLRDYQYNELKELFNSIDIKKSLK